MSHGDLYERAKEAIDAVFGDNSVSRKTTRSSLEELVKHTQIKLSTLDTIDAALDRHATL